MAGKPPKEPSPTSPSSTPSPTTPSTHQSNPSKEQPHQKPQTARLTTFTELMALIALPSNENSNNNNNSSNGSAERYMNLCPPFNPGGVSAHGGPAYGGHVYAQAVWAASQGVEAGMVVHNVHGYFTLPGLSDRPFIYSITSLSSGRSYSTRLVTVRQPISPSFPRPQTPSSPIPQPRFSSPASFERSDAEKELGRICFVCLCSFKRDEPVGVSHQVEADLDRRFASVLGGRRVEEHAVVPVVDAPWYHRQNALQPFPNRFPGLIMRRVDMEPYNSTANPSSTTPAQHRQLIFYRPIGTLPPTAYNLHASAHLYASDRNSLFVISNACGYGDEVGSMASLSHSVVFHVSSKELVLQLGDAQGEGEGDEGRGEWWCQETWTPRSGGGRGIHQSRIWDVRGKHVASSWQEGVVRKAECEEDMKQKMFWNAAMRQMGNRGKL